MPNETFVGANQKDLDLDKNLKNNKSILFVIGFEINDNTVLCFINYIGRQTTDKFINFSYKMQFSVEPFFCYGNKPLRIVKIS